MTQPSRECHFRFISQPTDVNWGGKVHGGMVMKWMDQAGYACAVGWSGRYAVTASVGGMSFLEPIRIGDLVEVHARIILTGTSSMHIAVDVDSIELTSQHRTRTTRCVMVFVAVDADGRPTAVPPWAPASTEDRRLADYAARLKTQRAQLERDLYGAEHS
jgi:acyl-CoA hydrolase